ncbi:hypothetical protein K491DRAFT_716043 [Lophiostoma macrostomum CBS 122681]|uniref:Uncharacterized protein n=1 Tax=Lophiostoma macrostomum CBS 122681 TaxID=1314788 RepID=A0A6A6T6U9_9PLEO|nr:hypothetical protein K491DRAFT_716043 [Lophiostoma macrostomum CBS 122681]
MPFWPFTTFFQSPSPPTEADSDPLTDGFFDVAESLSGIRPSSQRDMQEFVRAREEAEHSPEQQPKPSAVRRLSQQLLHDRPTMDADILADSVKQKEVLEKTNFADHFLAARKKRHHRRCLGGSDEDEVMERVNLVIDKRGEVHMSKSLEMSRGETTCSESGQVRFEGERTQDWDDCFVTDDDPSGYLGYVLIKKVGKGNEESPSQYTHPAKAPPLNWFGWLPRLS